MEFLLKEYSREKKIITMEVKAQALIKEKFKCLETL